MEKSALDSKQLIVQATSVAEKGDLKRALAQCADILRADPKNPDAFFLYRRLYRSIHGHDLAHAEIFDFIYTSSTWRPGSGPGSTPKNTEPYRAFLQDFLKKHAIRSVLDAGSGDWQFSQLIDWSGIDYLGLDVSSVALSNSKKHAAPNIRFVEGDFRTYDVPAADLLLMKDVIQHWPNSDVLAVLPKFKQFRFCLITNGFAPGKMAIVNTPSATGGWRPVDLSLPPFTVPGSYVFTYHGDEEKRVYLIQSGPVGRLAEA